MLGYLELVLAATAYAGGIVAQTVAARRAERRDRIDPGLLLRLARDRLYLVGFAAQVLGFVSSFLARETLPLYLVQAGSSAAVGLATLFGVLVLGWTVRRGELVAVAIMAAGLILLVGASRPSVAAELPAAAVAGLAAALVLVGLAAVPAARLGGRTGAVALGVLGGVAFAVLAVVGRPLAVLPLVELPAQPSAWLMVAAALLGQYLLASALQRGRATATMASLDSTTTVFASVAGLTLLADRAADGRGAWVPLGLALVVGAIIALAATPVRAPARPAALERT